MRRKIVLIMHIEDSFRSCREEIVRLVTLNEAKMITLDSGENLGA